jgi:integrase/recombinase XerD
MNNYQWKSCLADHMQTFLMLKRMAGFKYEEEARLMEKFDQYCYDNGFTSNALNFELSMIFVMEFIMKKLLPGTVRKNY